MTSHQGARAIAVDPGADTGIAVLTSRNEIVTLTLDTSEGDVAGLLSLLVEQAPHTVVVERFITSGMMSRYGLHTVELVGAIKAWQHLNNDATTGRPPVDLVFRTPSQRTVCVPEAKRILSLRRSTLGARHTDHEVAALAHLIGWMRSHNIEGATMRNMALPKPGA